MLQMPTISQVSIFPITIAKDQEQLLTYIADYLISFLNSPAGFAAAKKQKFIVKSFSSSVSFDRLSEVLLPI